MEPVTFGYGSFFRGVNFSGNLVVFLPAKWARLDFLAVIGAQSEKFSLTIHAFYGHIAVAAQALALLHAIAADADNVAFLIAAAVGNLSRSQVAAHEYLMLDVTLFDVPTFDQQCPDFLIQCLALVIAGRYCHRLLLGFDAGHIVGGDLPVAPVNVGDLDNAALLLE